MTTDGDPATRRRLPRLTGLAGTVLGLAAAFAAWAKDGTIDARSVRHDADGPDEVVWATAENPATRFLSVRFTCARADAISRAGLRIYRLDDQGLEGFRDHDASRYAGLDDLEVRALTVPLSDDPRVGPEGSRWRGYRIWLDDQDRLFWSGRDSVSTKESVVPRFDRLFPPARNGQGISDHIITIPGWATDAVAIRIDVATFRNGDPSNDPKDGRPGGDLAGLAAAIPSLDSLGVTLVLLSSLVTTCPIDPTAPIDLMSIDPRYGNLELFEKVVQQAHSREMRVVATLPLAAISRSNPWVSDALYFKEESAFHTFFDFPRTDDGAIANAADTTGTVPWNADNPEVVDELLKPVQLWARTRLDGWYLPDLDSQPPSFWQSLTAAMKALDPKSWIIGQGTGPLDRWMTGDLVDAIDTPAYEAAVMPFATGKERDAMTLCAALDKRRVETPEPFTRTSVNPLGAAPDDAAGRLATFLQLTSEGVPLLDASSPLLSGSRRWVRELIEIRKEHPSLRRGSVEPIYVQGGVACVLRRTSEEMFLVVVNQEPTPLTTRLPIRGSFGQVSQKDAVDLLSGTRHAIRSGELFLKDVPAGGMALVRLR
ncbi:MAG TPA: alpha-amylase family glycosyl hydrolase [Candidatus Eisenbacteria bacterium]